MKMFDIGVVEPTKLTLNSRFKFNCYKGIGCFTRCCGSTDILLTPYDILRMKKRLGISSQEFLKRYTYIHIDERSSHPYVILKMMDEKGRRCPFVGQEGCSIYTDRPTNCRYYPIGQALIRSQSDKGLVNEEFYFLIRDPNCLGYQENNEWTIQTWRIDQGVDIYDDMNKEWREVQLRRDVHGHRLDDKKQRMFYMASYDIDRFRKYIFESGLLDIIDIDKQEVEKIKADEIALMKFGFRYLKYILMLEETIKVKEGYRKKA